MRAPHLASRPGAAPGATIIWATKEAEWAQAPHRDRCHSEVALKSEVGVLFDANAKRAFDAIVTEGPDGTMVAA